MRMILNFLLQNFDLESKQVNFQSNSTKYTTKEYFFSYIFSIFYLKLVIYHAIQYQPAIIIVSGYKIERINQQNLIDLKQILGND